MMTWFLLGVAFWASSLAAALDGVADAAPAAPSPSVTTATLTPSTERSSYSYVHVDGPYIAITFDDGPHAKNTPRLLDLLAARHIKATFA